MDSNIKEVLAIVSLKLPAANLVNHRLSGMPTLVCDIARPTRTKVRIPSSSSQL